MKKILFALLLTSHCFIAINNTPITTTPTDEINYDESDEASEYSNDRSEQDSEYWNNRSDQDSEYWDFSSDEDSEYSNSFSACISCKLLREIASEAWNRWIKPLIIRNSINDTTGEINNEEVDEDSEYLELMNLKREISNEETDEDSEYLEMMNLKEDENSEYLYVMVNAYPIRERLVKYFATFNNTNLLPARMSCKSFYEIANEVLRKRIKPLIIRNGTISSATDQRIFPIYKTTDDIYRDFLVLTKWHADFVLNHSNPRSTECQLSKSACLHRTTIYFQTLVTRRNFHKFSTHLPHDAVLIPKMYIPNVAYFKGNNYFSDQYIPTDEWKMATREAKLVIIFTDNSSFDIDEEINFNIRSIGKNHPVSICYAIYNYPSRIPSDENAFLIFHGSNVEASTFHVETTDEGELREKLLEWKHGLDFLKSYHIIAFHFTKELMEPVNSEEIFSRIFGIRPLIVQVDTEWFTRTGLIHVNSTMTVKSLGQVFAVVGFKKF